MEAANLNEQRGLIYRWAYRVLQNHDDALDVTQGVLVRRLQAGAVRPEKQLAWLRRVTFNLSIDTLRRRQPSVPLEEGDLPSNAATRAAEAGDVLESSERHERVLGALASLSELQRQVLMVKTFDGHTFADIAAGLGLSASSVKTHYVRALGKMREQLRSAEY